MTGASLVLALSLLAPAGSGLVVVFTPEAPGELAWLAEAAAERLPRALAALGMPALERADRLRAQEALEIPVAAPLSRATMIRIAEGLGATHAVVGTVAPRGPAVLLTLHVVDVARGDLGPALTATGPAETAEGLVDSLAWDVARDGPVARPPREAFLVARPRVAPAAFRAFGGGLAAREAATRVRLLRQALAEAPGFDDARLALGRALLEAREFPAAHEVLARVGAGSPLERVARFLQGTALLEAGRYREAASLYARLVGERPTAAVLNNYGLALLRGGGTADRPSQVLGKAVEMDPGSTDLAFNLGWALLLENQPEAASFWLRGVVRGEPLDARARVALAWALAQQGRAAEAEEQWKAVEALAPAFASLRRAELTRRFERVLVSEHALAGEPQKRSEAELAATLAARGERLLQAGDLDGALRELTRAAYLEPYGTRVHVVLARVHRARGELDKAENELRMSLWSKDDLAVRVELAQLLLEMGREGDGRAEAEKVLRADPTNAAALKLLGRAGAP